jgi:hypothetical protein
MPTANKPPRVPTNLKPLSNGAKAYVRKLKFARQMKNINNELIALRAHKALIARANASARRASALR